MTVQELIEKDNTFTEADFIAKVDNTYIMYLSAIMTGNLPRVDHKIGDELYKKAQQKLDLLNKNNQRQMYDELNVKTSNILSIDETEDKYIIKVNLISRYMDYIVDKNTNEFISGNNTSRVEIQNILTFEKNKNAKDFKNIKKCPTCGASIDFNNNGQCPFCKNIFNTEDYDWVLISIEN